MEERCPSGMPQEVILRLYTPADHSGRNSLFTCTTQFGIVFFLARDPYLISKSSMTCLKMGICGHVPQPRNGHIALSSPGKA